MSHPKHAVNREVRIAGLEPFWVAAQPSKGPLLFQYCLERECKRNGGHWWHPNEDKAWWEFCCQCGKERRRPAVTPRQIYLAIGLLAMIYGAAILGIAHDVWKWWSSLK